MTNSSWRALPLLLITLFYSIMPVYAADKLAGGDLQSLAVAADGTVRGWGNSVKGALGPRTEKHSAPALVAGLSGIKAVASGRGYSLALGTDGTLWSWGDNRNGQLGATEKRDKPAKIVGLTEVTDMAAGATFALALRRDGTVWSWGSNNYGQLGDGTTNDRATPRAIPNLKNVRAVAAGAYHALAVTIDGKIWSWGKNSDGQLATELWKIVQLRRPSTVLVTPKRWQRVGGIVWRCAPMAACGHGAATRLWPSAKGRKSSTGRNALTWQTRRRLLRATGTVWRFWATERSWRGATTARDNWATARPKVAKRQRKSKI